MKTVPQLTLDILLATTEETIFSELEGTFLSVYAPHIFLGTMPTSFEVGSHEAFETNQIVYDTIVKLDVTIARGANLQRLYAEKSVILNPYFRAAGLGEVQEQDDPLTALLALKMKGLELLRLTIAGTDTNTMVHRSADRDILDGAKTMREILGDIPMAVYGSALHKESPPDIDLVAFPDRIERDTYARLISQYDHKCKPLLSCVLVPQDFISTHVLSDPHHTLSPELSQVINGSIEFPEPTAEHLRNIRLHNAALMYIQARTALTGEGQRECEGILPRINARCKLPRFVYQRLRAVSAAGLPEPSRVQFSSLPDVAEFRYTMSRLNVEMERMLEIYLRSQK